MAETFLGAVDLQESTGAPRSSSSTVNRWRRSSAADHTRLPVDHMFLASTMPSNRSIRGRQCLVRRCWAAYLSFQTHPTKFHLPGGRFGVISSRVNVVGVVFVAICRERKKASRVFVAHRRKSRRTKLEKCLMSRKGLVEMSQSDGNEI